MIRKWTLMRPSMAEDAKANDRRYCGSAASSRKWTTFSVEPTFWLFRISEYFFVAGPDQLSRRRELRGLRTRGNGETCSGRPDLRSAQPGRICGSHLWAALFPGGVAINQSKQPILRPDSSAFGIGNSGMCGRVRTARILAHRKPVCGVAKSSCFPFLWRGYIPRRLDAFGQCGALPLFFRFSGSVQVPK